MQKVKRKVSPFVSPFLIHHYSMNSCSMWISNYKKSTYKLNYVGKLDTHSTQQTIHRLPTLQRLCPPISMSRAAVPPTNGTADPYGPVQGTRGWVRQRNGWFTCLGRWQETHQKKEKNMVRQP
jgi:hypothetical protein